MTELNAQPGQLRNKSKKTLRTYRQAMEAFCRWLAPDHQLEHCVTTIGMVDRALLVEYFGWCYEHRAENTVLRNHIAMTLFFKFCIDYEILEDSPMRHIRRPHPMVKETPILTDAQVQALLATCEKRKRWIDKRDNAIFRVWLSTGLRLAELTAIEVADVDMAEGIIEIKRGKGGRPRTVAIGPKVKRALLQYIYARNKQEHADDPALWLSYQGAYTADAIRAMVYRRAKEAGLRGVHPHTFRHLFAHGFLAAKGEAIDLMELAGWSSMEMIKQRYGKAKAKERAIDAHHSLNIGEKW